MKSSSLRFVVSVLSFLLLLISQTDCLDVIYALNAGGDSFVDSHGIRYRRDYLTDGTASDYGKALDIKRVPSQDRILYQTERYATETFGYNIPMPSNDGDYVLWLKFSEVWFNAPNQKVFDVAINDDIVVKDLDIFEKVGRGVAHDEIVPFQVRQNKLIVNGKGSPFSSEIRVEFIKTDRDNPKINAIIVVKGTPDQIPQLLPYKIEKQYEEEFDDESEEKLSNYDNNNDEDAEEEDVDDIRVKRAQMEQMQRNGENDEYERQQSVKKKSSVLKDSTPKVVDPYASDETSYIIPILVAVGAFIPLLFCLCKL